MRADFIIYDDVEAGHQAAEKEARALERDIIRRIARSHMDRALTDRLDNTVYKSFYDERMKNATVLIDFAELRGPGRSRLARKQRLLLLTT